MKRIKDIAKVGDIWRCDYAYVARSSRTVFVTAVDRYTISCYCMDKPEGIGFYYKSEFYQSYSLLQGVDGEKLIGTGEQSGN